MLHDKVVQNPINLSNAKEYSKEIVQLENSRKIDNTIESKDSEVFRQFEVKLNRLQTHLTRIESTDINNGKIIVARIPMPHPSCDFHLSEKSNITKISSFRSTELHTDNGTIRSAQDILSENTRQNLDSTKEVISISNHCYRNIMNCLRGKAFKFRDYLVSSSEKNDRNLSQSINALLNNPKVRRGSAVTEPELQKRCQIIIEKSIAKKPLKYSVLLLPFRDRCEIKHQSHLPDLGETISILRLWAIGSAIKTLVENKRDALESILTKMEKNNLGEIISFDKNDLSLKEFSLDFLNKTQKENDKKIFHRILDYQDSAISIKDTTSFKNLIIKMKKKNVTLTDLLLLNANDKSNTYIIGLRDPERYACFDSTSIQDKQEYEQSLEFIHKTLNLDDSMNLLLLQKGAKISVTDKNQSAQKIVYDEIYGEILSKLELGKADILKSNSSIQLKNHLSSLCKNDDKIDKVCELYESTLLSINSEQTKNYFQKKQFTYTQKAHFLTSLYEHNGKNKDEFVAKQSLIWEGIIAAAKYVASYYSNSKNYNRLGYDDVDNMVPETIRATIHRKPESLGQPCLSLGPNPHRTPWHGTSALIENKKTKKHYHTTLLDIECRGKRLTPITFSKEEPLNKKQSDYPERMALNEYPIFYIQKDYNKSENIDKGIIEIINNTKFF